MTLADDVKVISTFVSHEQVRLDSGTKAPQHYDTIVLCVSAIFHCAETLFHALQQRGSDLTATVVLCGGIGHSTPHLYSAVAENPRYAHLADQINGLPEAQVMEKIFDACFSGHDVRNSGVKVLVEDQSTNCGANATETRRLLQKFGLLASGSKMLIIQDPTMSLRTKMSFEKAFEGDGVIFEACPTFVPRVTESDGKLRFEEGADVTEDELWDMDRFLGLILGEIVRLKDDETGYGPRGKGFIGHVDVPDAVLEAYARLEKSAHAKR
ncbi:unnamed protein product [Aureobasidium mustum]|uniref:DUF218 domain-containing protein n=1 Tax=Aureobasidium mustum TaxID=2773714 RepID=A0A9N8K5T1_9PEZI|nr:unnamed protein product [Aureobasidium mustum]